MHVLNLDFLDHDPQRIAALHHRFEHGGRSRKPWSSASWNCSFEELERAQPKTRTPPEKANPDATAAWVHSLAGPSAARVGGCSGTERLSVCGGTLVKLGADVCYAASPITRLPSSINYSPGTAKPACRTGGMSADEIALLRI